MRSALALHRTGRGCGALRSLPRREAARGSRSPSGSSATGTARDVTKLRERLANVHERLRRTRANLRVLEEQVAYLNDIADDAEVRRLVAQTPLADREWREAKTDHERHARLLEETLAQVAELAAERDRLLDRLLDVEGMR
ncbi:MAG TPA: hypothetical protein VHF25_09590 [Nitriliruptorales bacterium]|nr:hypothetical protein [Nitriliruptorales bacterium]